MDLYTSVAYKTSKLLTLEYSSSFGMSSLLFPRAMRAHIYAIYGLVRIADEIVDTYRGDDASQLLDQLKKETYEACKKGYSANPIVHAFASTAQVYGIGAGLIEPFFESMAIDLSPQIYDDSLYRRYIHGSAEVVGLMCLKVFSSGDAELYARLKDGAAALGAAYQKVNFLRDIQEDYHQLGRTYFPGVSFESLDETGKHDIIADIRKDFDAAYRCIVRLPKSSRLATLASYVYYSKLLQKLSSTHIDLIKQTRVRIPAPHKLLLLVSVLAKEGWKK